MNRYKPYFWALLIVGMLGGVASAKAAHPLAGKYLSDDVYGFRLFIEISSRGAVSGAWGIDFDYYTVSGRISADGLLNVTLKRRGKRYTDRFSGTGELALDDSGSLVGVIQFEGAEPQQVVLVRQ